MSASEHREYSFDILSQYFKLSDESPSGIARISNNKFCASYGSNRRYWTAYAIGHHWVMHRVKHVLYHKTDLKIGVLVDHIDGNGLNNSIENLRIVSTKINSRNKKMQETNKSGVTGVHLKAFTKKVKDEYREYLYWCVQWYPNNSLQPTSKSFSLIKYGSNEAFKLACKFREDILEQLGDYTERHGKEYGA